VASFVFQLEVFEDVPGVGAVSGALLNVGFMRRVEVTARRVFQERWLRDNGKVHEIKPAEAHARALAGGFGGAVARAVYAGCYYVGFGASLPAWYLASLFGAPGGPLARGARDGAAAAFAAADGLASSAGAPAPGLAPA
jgi:hypothetical protein